MYTCRPMTKQHSSMETSQQVEDGEETQTPTQHNDNRQSFLRPKVKVSVQAASPTPNMEEMPHPLVSHAASKEENVRASLEVPEDITRSLTRSCSASSTESEYTTPRQSWSEMEEAKLREKLAERPAPTKPLCSNCVKLRRSLSNSENETRSVLANFLASEALAEKLKEEVVLKKQENCVLMGRCEDAILYIQELEETVTQLSMSMEREEIEKKESRRHFTMLLEVLLKSVQTPIHINMQERRVSQAQGCGELHQDNGRGSEFTPTCGPNGGVPGYAQNGSEFAPTCGPNGGVPRYAQNGSEFAPASRPNGGVPSYAQNGSEFAPVNGGDMHPRCEALPMGHPVTHRRPAHLATRGDRIKEKLVELLNPSGKSTPPRGRHASHLVRSAVTAATPPPNLRHSISGRNNTHIRPYRHASHNHGNTFEPPDRHAPHQDPTAPHTHHQDPTPTQSSPEHLPQTETGYWEAEGDYVNSGGNFLPV